MVSSRGFFGTSKVTHFLLSCFMIVSAVADSDSNSSSSLRSSSRSSSSSSSRSGSLRDSCLTEANLDPEAKESAITLLETTDSKVKVKVAQTMFGSLGLCAKDEESTATLMFATYLNPNSTQLDCGLRKEEVDACFESSFWIGCDAATKMATIDLYIVDENFCSTVTTDNPKIGLCRHGDNNNIKRGIKISQSYACETVTSGPPPCQTSEDCPSGSYCTTNSLGALECREYAAVGDSCGGRTLSGPPALCNPSTSFCFVPNGCRFADRPGTCKALGADCTSDANCPGIQYCDSMKLKCIGKLAQDDCCDTGRGKQCGRALECSPDPLNNVPTCRPVA